MQASTSQNSYSTTVANQGRSVSSLRGATHAATGPSYSTSLYPSRVPGSTYGGLSNPSSATTTYSVQRLLQKSLADAPPSSSNSFASASSSGSILDTSSNSLPSGYYSSHSFNQTAPIPQHLSSHHASQPPIGSLSRHLMTQSSATPPRSPVMIATMPMPRATPAAGSHHHSPLPSFDTARPSSAHLRAALQQSAPLVPSSLLPQAQWSGYSYGLSAPGNLPPPLTQPMVTRQGSSLSPQSSYSLSQQQVAFQNQQQQYQRELESQRPALTTKAPPSNEPPSMIHTSKAAQHQVQIEHSSHPQPSSSEPNPQILQRSASVQRQASHPSVTPPSQSPTPAKAIAQKPPPSIKAQDAGRRSCSGLGTTTTTNGPYSDASSVTSSSNASLSHALSSHASATISSSHTSAVIRLPSLSDALKVLMTTPMPGMGCVGLQNLGNTCFLNSILQSLNAVPELVAAMLLARNGQCSSKLDCKWNSKAIAAPAYSDFVAALWSASPYSAISPNAFLRRIAKIDARWGEGGQQDSQEFLHSLLGALQSETNRVLVKPKYRELDGKGSEAQQAEVAAAYSREWHDSVVDDIFGGLLQSTIQCRTCGKESHTFETFVDLSLPIPSSSKSAHVSLQDCLNCFTATESLEGDDSYKCEGCKSCQPHTKRLRIYRYPRILILTLKRFASRSGCTSIFSRFRSTQKNGAAVGIPEESSHSRAELEGEVIGSPRSTSHGSTTSLDLSPYCNPMGLRSQLLSSPQSGHRDREGGAGALDAWPALPPSYRLISVSHHSGSLEGGHYTAVAQGAVDGSWYNFNDASVRRESKPPGGPSSSAYVLFYRLAGI